MALRSIPVPAVLLAAAVVVTGCRHPSKTYETKVRIERVTVVQRDDKGGPTSTDVDFVWSACPGDQKQTMRGGLSLSQCAGKLKPGSEVPAKVVREWDDHGHYDWHVVNVDGCETPPVDDDDSSFESVAHCEPSHEHDAVVGFHCDKAGASELLKKCPWFRP